MEMTNELKLIMQRRLEKSENNSNVAFVSPKSKWKKSSFVSNTKMPPGSGGSKPTDDMNTDGRKYEVIKYENKDLSHLDLKGKERLFNVVQLLGGSCPWTISIASKTMLSWLRSELDELEKELDILEMLQEKREFDLVTQEEKNDSLDVVLQSLTSEMGDILFDTLMLEMIIRREYNLEENAAWDAAAEKIERRTPYMKGWGDGKSVAKTPEEATVIWNSVKNEEKKLPLPPLLERIILEQKEKSKEIVVNGVSDKIENQNNCVDTVDETLEEDDSIESSNLTGVEDEKLISYPSDEQENDHLRVTNILSKDERGDTPIVQEKEEQKKSIIERKDSFPLTTRNFVRITEVLGLQKFNETSAITSASLGFAAGALIVTLLQRIRFR